MSFDISTLTMGEITQIEELSKTSFTAMSDDTAPKGRLFTAIAFIARKREDPTYTINQAEALTMADLGVILGSDVTETPDPKVTR